MATQLTIFDILTPPPPPPAVAAAPILSRRDRERAEWEAFRAKQDAAEAAGEIETIKWGKGDRTRGPSYHLDLWQDGEGWRIRQSLATGMGGSWGQFTCNTFPTRQDAMLAAFRDQLRRSADFIVVDHDSRKDERAQHEQLVRWIVGRLIPGADLDTEYREMLRIATAREKRRTTAFRAVYDLHGRVEAIMKSIEIYAYGGSFQGGLMHNKAAKPCSGRGADPLGHAKAWPAEWAISGHAPDALSVTIYPRDGQTDSKTVRAAHDALSIALSEPIIMAAEDAPYPHGNWTWDEEGAA